MAAEDDGAVDSGSRGTESLLMQAGSEAEITDTEAEAGAENELGWKTRYPCCRCRRRLSPPAPPSGIISTSSDSHDSSAASQQQGRCMFACGTFKASRMDSHGWRRRCTICFMY